MLEVKLSFPGLKYVQLAICKLVTLAQDCLMASLSSVCVMALVTITRRRGELSGLEHTNAGESRGLLASRGSLDQFHLRGK